MTYANKLKYAGNDPYKPEDERLPYPVFEALTNGADPAGQYERLAQVRWLADELESEVAGDADVPDEARDHLFQAVADTNAPLQVMVDTYVAGWLQERAVWLVEEWGLEPETVAMACGAYGLPETVERVGAVIDDA